MVARLGVSRTTVRSHVQALLTKLGVHSRLEAASFAVRYRLLDDDLERVPPGARGLATAARPRAAPTAVADGRRTASWLAPGVTRAPRKRLTQP